MKITIKGGLYFDADPVTTEGRVTFFRGSLHKFSKYTPICEYTIEAETPEGFDPTQAEVAALKARREEVSKQFAETVRVIDQRINSLLAIGCATEVA